MSKRRIDTTQSFEKFSNKGSTRTHKKRSSQDRIIERITQDIIRVTQGRGRGAIPAGRFEDAVDVLKRWLKRHSKNMIMRAFGPLVKSGLYRFNHEQARYDFMAIAA